MEGNPLDLLEKAWEKRTNPVMALTGVVVLVPIGVNQFQWFFDKINIVVRSVGQKSVIITLVILNIVAYALILSCISKIRSLENKIGEN